MNLLHPWYLAGLAAVGLPLAVHFLTRPRPRTLPLSTLRFVREAVQQRRARYRLRDLLILLLRTAAVALIAIAFARPLIGAKKVQTASDGNAARVVILDRSLSMAAVSNGVQAFERARAAAASQLEYAAGLRGNLILVGAQPRPVFPGVSNNFTALREALSAARPRSEGLNLKAAIDMAGDMLAKVPPGQPKELIVVSDFQRSNWAAADFSPLPAETVIHLQSVAPAQTPANLAVTRVAARGRVEQNRLSRVEVDIANFSSTPRDVQAEVSIAGATYHLNGHCSPGQTATLSTDVILPAIGWQEGLARLVGAQDALAADDSRPFVLDVRPPLSFLLVTRESAEPRATSSHFLELALAPVKPREGHQGEHVTRIDPSSLDRDAVGGADVIVIDHPGRLPAEAVKLIASVVRRGRALLYVASEPADASNLSLLAEAAGSDLKMPVQFVPPPAGAPRLDLFIASTRQQSSIFRTFGENLTAALAPLRFNGGLDSRKLDTGLADDLLASFSDRSACLVLTRCGAGKVAVLNADLGESNLPASSAFVPLLGELTGALVERGGDVDAFPCGDLLVSALPPEAGTAQGLIVAGPKDSDASLGTLSDDAGGVTWRWDEAGPPGVYQVKRGGATVFALATAAPASESDLQAIDPAVLTGRLSGGRTIHFQAAGEDEPRRETAWSWIVAACIGCMVLEVVTLKAFRT